MTHTVSIATTLRTVFMSFKSIGIVCIGEQSILCYHCYWCCLLLQLVYLLTSDDRWNYHSMLHLLLLIVSTIMNAWKTNKQTHTHTHCIQTISRKVTFDSIPGSSYTYIAAPEITANRRRESNKFINFIAHLNIDRFHPSHFTIILMN